MNWLDAVVMAAGLPLCAVVVVVLGTSVFFIFLPAVLGVTVTIERLCDLALAVGHRLFGPRAG